MSRGPLLSKLFKQGCLPSNLRHFSLWRTPSNCSSRKVNRGFRDYCFKLIPLTLRRLPFSAVCIHVPFVDRLDSEWIDASNIWPFLTRIGNCINYILFAQSTNDFVNLLKLTTCIRDFESRQLFIDWKKRYNLKLPG